MSKYSFSKAVRKLILNQFGAAIFGFLIFEAGVMLSVYIEKNNTSTGTVETVIDTIVLVVAVLFYMLLQYTAIWDIAAEDRIHIEAGKYSYDRFAGIKSALLANIPNFVLALLCSGGAFLYYFTKNDFFANISGVSHSAITIWESMFDAILAVIKPVKDSLDINRLLLSLNYFTITIPSLLICTLGYKAGYNNKFKLGKKS